MNIAIILASGSGRRMGKNINKVLLKLENKPLLYWTLKAFQNHPAIDQIILVSHKRDFESFNTIKKENAFDKIITIIEGGIERQQSAHNAIKFLDQKISSSQKEKTVLLFHNGANPFVTEQEITLSIQKAQNVGACAVAHPTKDTIKEVTDKNLVIRTLERKHLRNMQTPQTINFNLAQKAFFSAEKESFLGTDDVSLVERLNLPVEIIPASLYNFKITTPLDLELAQLLISKKYIDYV